ncbi:hypothetical protein SETIT_9G240500v2 [Setaria italica]|uniref:Uncharacterized protein n=2 Tax=Setaria TaxID=4554 RepID=A0A368SJY0_SETIT|nr:hypothetical protein SETIT_9G240500v2 [Setaria italica]TKV93665.1 hypothetical protein SEVIR_9G240500v2 [Setaria viridis]
MLLLLLRGGVLHAILYLRGLLRSRGSRSRRRRWRREGEGVDGNLLALALPLPLDGLLLGGALLTATASPASPMPPPACSISSFARCSLKASMARWMASRSPSRDPSQQDQ